jgi:hypothetical protein
MDKFKKESAKSITNPYDYYNSDKSISDEQFERDISKFYKSFAIDGKKWIRIGEGMYQCLKSSKGLQSGVNYNRYQMLTALAFDGNWRASSAYIEVEYLNADVPYIRVGRDYFKRIKKLNQWDIVQTELKVWSRDTIIHDFGKDFADTRVNKYDDFIVRPDNINYSPTFDGMYNLYAPFPHEPYDGVVSLTDIETTAALVSHIFGDQSELGWKYFKILYEYPKQMLPVLTLVSKDRQTGKTTVLNYLDMLFGDNYAQIPPDDLLSNFNISYAEKNIIGIDEAVIDKSSAVEKIKSLATASTLTVNPKHVNPYKIPFYGKLVITTNKERDFMRIDSEEIRFWVRKIPKVKQMRADIYERLKSEIPKFLRYLINMEDIEFGKSRMVFTSDEIFNSHLNAVMVESYSTARKDIIDAIRTTFFNNNLLDEIKMSSIDILNEFFPYNNRYNRSYIAKVVTDEMGIARAEKNERYAMFGGPNDKTGLPYTFKRRDFVKIEEESDQYFIAKNTTREAVINNMIENIDDEAPF